MMYHTGFRPKRVFTAPLNSGNVIVPLGVPAGTFTFVSSSIGMSNLPDFSNWTGPARSGLVSESAGGNCEMSTFVPIEARGGMVLHPGTGPFAAGPGPLPARKSPPFSCAAAKVAAEKYMIAAAVAAISTGLARFDHLLMLTLFRPFLWLFIANPPPVEIFPSGRP